MYRPVGSRTEPQLAAIAIDRFLIVYQTHQCVSTFPVLHLLKLLVCLSFLPIRGLDVIKCLLLLHSKLKGLRA